MSWYVGACLNVLLDEINASAPGRSKVSDGSIGDQSHQNSDSDHNPCDCHEAVCARDFTHDPGGGFDSYAFADWLRQRCKNGAESRVKYIVSNRQITSGTYPDSYWTWRPYSGSNPHTGHAHVSVNHGPEKFNNKQGWGWSGTPVDPGPGPVPTQEDDEMMTGLWKRQNDDKTYAVFSNGTKQWGMDLSMIQGYQNLARLNGVQPEVQTCEDPGLFAAMGIILPGTPVPPGVDQWGNPEGA